MTIYADFLANTKSMDITAPIVADDRKIKEWLEAQVARGDVAYLAAYDAKNEVQGQAIHTGTPTAGTFTLTITLRSGQQFTTAGIAYNANAATIEGAIDTAATSASVPGWTNGDIAVTGGPLTTTPTVYTFSGTSVAGQNHGLTVATGPLTGGDVGAVTTTTDGQTKRTSWAILAAVGAITAGMPLQGVSVTKFDLTAGDRDSNSEMPSAAVLRKLAEEAGIEDLNQTVVTAILEALRLA